MKNDKFKPMLCPNQEVDIKSLSYPLMASTKLDGIRCIFHPELGIVSRSLKPIPNKQINEKMRHILDYCKKYNLILDGELYHKALSFQQITSLVMTKDFEDSKTTKKLEKENSEFLRNYFITEDGEYINFFNPLHFYCFDCININLEYGNMIPFKERFNMYISTDLKHMFPVEQFLVRNHQMVEDYYSTAIERNCEGLILKDPKGKYKYGRGTVNEELCFKVKPFIEKSAIIKSVVQATIVDPNAKKKINELGYSETSKKKDDRILIERAACFLVDWEGKDLKISIAATIPEKENIWNNKEIYIGKEVCFKAMDVGAKDLPRHPTTTRWWLENE